MLWRSSRRWKFQRSRIGKLPAIAWCLNIDCSATSSVLPSSTAASSSSVRAVLGPQPRRLQRAQPVDDAAEHGEEQRLEHADGGGEQRHQRDVAAQPVAAGPDEGQEAARRQHRRAVGIGLDESFEGGKQRCLRARGKAGKGSGFAPRRPRGATAQCRAWTSARWLAQYGYAFVFVGALAEGESVLLVAGFAAHRGLLKLPEVMALAFVAGTLGDQICFYLGRRHGPALLARFPSLADARRAPAADAASGIPNAAILSVRFLYGLRTAGPIALGTLGVSRWRFALLNMLSAALWAVAFSLLGYQFGNALQWLLDDLRSVEEGVLAALLAAALVWAVWRRLRRA